MMQRRSKFLDCSLIMGEDSPYYFLYSYASFLPKRGVTDNCVFHNYWKP